MLDADVLERARKGEKAAVGQLYEEHIREVYRFVFFKVGSKEDAEDVTQEVFIAGFEGLRNFRGNSSFRNWLYEIAKHKIADLWREKYRMPTTDIEAVLGLETATVMTTAEEQAATEQHDLFRQEQVGAVLGKLKASYREVLEYRFLKNYSIKETATAMGISVANAKVLQHRALKSAATLGSHIFETSSRLIS